MLRKAIGLLTTISLVLTIGLTGCGSSSAPASSAPASSAPASSAPASSQTSSKAKTIIRIGHANPPNTTSDNGAKRFKELVEKKTNGAVEVQIFGNSQLGGENDMMNLIQMGSLEMEVTGDGIINMFIPAYGALTMPYAFRDTDHLVKVYQNAQVVDALNADLTKAKGSFMIDAWVRGPRNLTTNKKVTTPADLKGQKLRVPEMKVYLETWKRFGALPTPMAFSEVYSALQQHVVEGQENPYDLIFNSSFFEVQKYLVKTQHVFGPYMIIIGDKFFKGLSPDIQKAVTESIKEAGVATNKETLADQEKLEQNLKAKGMEIVTVNRDEFVKALEGLPAELEKSLNWKPGLYKQIIDTK